MSDTPNALWTNLDAAKKATITAWKCERYDLETKAALKGPLTSDELDRMAILKSCLRKHKRLLPNWGNICEELEKLKW